MQTNISRATQEVITDVVRLSLTGQSFTAPLLRLEVQNTIKDPLARILELIDRGDFPGAEKLVAAVITPVAADHCKRILDAAYRFNIPRDKVKTRLPDSYNSGTGGFDARIACLGGWIELDTEAPNGRVLRETWIERQPGWEAKLGQALGEYDGGLGNMHFDDRLVQALAAQSLSEAWRPVNQAGFIHQINKFCALKNDPAQLINAAWEQLLKIRNSAQAFEPIGNDVPVMFVPANTKLDRSDLLPLVAGHPWLVLGETQANVVIRYRLVLRDEQLKPPPQIGPITYLRSNANKLFRELSVTEEPFPCREDVRTVLDAVRRHLSPKTPETSLHTNLPYSDTEQAIHLKSFMGQNLSRPLTLVRCEIVRLTWQIDRFHDLTKPSLQKVNPKTVLQCLVGEEAGANFLPSQESVADYKIYIPFGSLADSKVTFLKRKLPDRALLMEDETGRTAIVFSRPFKIPGPIDEFGKPGAQSDLFGFQSLAFTSPSGETGFIPLKSAPEIVLAAHRFNKLGHDPIPVRANCCAPSFKTGVALNRLPLVPFFHEQLQQLGFPAIREQGDPNQYNCLFDGRRVIPYSCPTVAQWSSPILTPIAGLKYVPDYEWPGMVYLFRGKIVEQISGRSGFSSYEKGKPRFSLGRRAAPGQAEGQQEVMRTNCFVTNDNIVRYHLSIWPLVVAEVRPFDSEPDFTVSVIESGPVGMSLLVFERPENALEAANFLFDGGRICDITDRLATNGLIGLIPHDPKFREKCLAAISDYRASGGQNRAIPVRRVPLPSNGINKE